KGQGSFENIDELFALGRASVALGDLARADAAVEHLGTAAKTVPDADAREIAAIMAAELDGLLKIARKDRAGGLAALERAAALETKRPRPIARPYPIKPAGELYAEALLDGGDAAAAVAAFQAALTRTPRRAASLLRRSREGVPRHVASCRRKPPGARRSPHNPRHTTLSPCGAQTFSSFVRDEHN